jgi:hypothetical protein
MDLDLNFEPLIKIDSDKESEIDESSEYESSEGDEGSENDVVNALSNQMSPLAASSIISSSQIVTKGSKGQLFKSRTNDKPARTSEFNLGIFFGKLGDDAEIVLAEFTKYNNKKDQALADMTLRNAVRKYQITRRVALSVFGIGYTRWKRVMNNQLVVAKEDIKFSNPNSVTGDDLDAFKDFVNNLDKEPGYPCNHRRQKL